MNAKQLTDEYLKATNKANWVRVTAKKYGVAGSDIICELMKCGYKYAELNRVSESQYNSAVNKYHKWQEDGCPETELVPVEPEAEEKNSVIFTLENEEETAAVVIEEVMDQCTIESLSEAVERLEEENESLKGVIEIKDKSIQELLAENADLKNSLHNREDDIFEFKGKLDSTMDLVRTREEKISELENQIKHLKSSNFNATVEGMV